MNETSITLWCLLDMLFIGVPLWVLMFRYKANTQGSLKTLPQGGLRFNA
jgi:hypothetical protein